MYSAVVVQKFCKGDESFKNEERGEPVEVDNNQVRGIIEADPQNYMRSCQRTQCRPFYGCWAFAANWKGEQLDKRAPHKLTANQNSCCSGVLSSLILCNNKTCLYQIMMLWWKVDFIWQLETGSSGWIKKKLQSTSQSQTCTKIRSQSLVWWSDASLIHYSLLNPGETIIFEKYAQQIDKMHWKLQCLKLALVNRKGPILHNVRLHTAQPMLQKLNKLGYEVASNNTQTCLIYHSHLTSCQPTTVLWASQRFFAGKMLPQPENAFQEFVESWSIDFYAIGINKLTSC